MNYSGCNTSVRVSTVPMAMNGYHNKNIYIAILFLEERVINFDHFASISKLTRKHVGNMYLPSV
jgi:hypothetical protein